MKKLILSLILTASFSSFAQSADYVCEVMNFRVELTLTADETTSMWLTDTMNHEVIMQGYANFVEKKGLNSTYHFHQSGTGDARLTFKTKDAVDFPQRMTGVIQTTVRPILMRDTLNCVKR